ncbi:tripartite tricarboxylate transporter substrate binding protein BugE [Comamonas humi]
MPALAADWPTRPIRLVIPFASGGATNIIGRLVADSLSKELGVPVVPDNRGGAGGALGTGIVANAPADGYTIGVATVSTHVTNPVFMKLGYTPDKDLIPIIKIAEVPNVLEVHPSVPASDLRSFIKLLAANPEKYNFSSAGTGGINHVNCEMFAAATRTRMTHIPYKGSGPALADLLSGQVQSMCDQINSSLPFIKAGKVRALAVAAPTRLSSLPGVPTFAELGYPELNTMAWYGLMAPARTSQVIVDKLNTAANKIIKTQAFRDALIVNEAIAAGGTEAKFRADILSELKQVRTLIEERHLNVE